jgi:branched-chain amino acid transport system permease protein
MTNFDMKSFWRLLLLFGVALILPVIISEFWVLVMTEILIMGVFAMSFNLLFGYMGQLSFGHAAYFGIGAYTTGLMITGGHLPLPVCMLSSMVVAGLLGALLGFFIVRLTGIYFAILSMAFGQFIFYVIFKWVSFTGGDNGLQGINPPDFLSSAYAYYYFTLIVVTACVFAMWVITRSAFGYSMMAIRDNMERTRFIGVNIRKYMLINFVIATVFAGLAGSLFAILTRSIAPQIAGWENSGLPVFMTVIGGASNFFGPMVGAVVYVFLSSFVTGFTQYWPIVIGSILIFIVLFLPKGVSGVWKMIVQRKEITKVSG